MLFRSYGAFYDSRNFNFEGYGLTQTDAKSALQQALEIHTKEYKLDDDWYYKDDIFVLEYEVGKPYRDKEKMRAI